MRALLLVLAWALALLPATPCIGAEPATEAATSGEIDSETEEEESDEFPIVYAAPSWFSVDGARPTGTGLESSTNVRGLDAGVVWKTPGGRTWRLGLGVSDRDDSNLVLPGVNRPIGSFRGAQLNAFYLHERGRTRETKGILNLRGAGERPSDAVDVTSSLLFYGWDRQTSRTIRFGWGIVAMYRAGAGFRAFPAPTFEWDPPGGFSFVFAGPSSELRWDLNERWRLALSARVNLRRYRLQDGGIFVDDQVPLRLGLQRRIQGQTVLEVYGGKLLGRTWEVRDRPGLADTRLDVDSGTFVGVRATLPLNSLF